MNRRIATILVITISIFIGACSQTNHHPQDPYEGFNRSVFKFNKVVDKAVLKPIAYVYLVYLPEPFQFGISNFFDNLREIPNIANDVLQLNMGFAAHDTSRFLINTTLGLGGIFDPATSLGLAQRKEDFGQTLYRWGYHHSNYLMLPILGPSTVRDTIGLGVDYFALSIWPWIESDWQYALLAVDFIDLRARLLRKEAVLNVLAIDEYTFIRDAYLQRRQYLVTEAKSYRTDDQDKHYSVKQGPTDKEGENNTLDQEQGDFFEHHEATPPA